MVTFLALYRGQTITEARIITATSNPKIISEVSAALLATPDDVQEPDPVIRELDHGQRAVLRLVHKQAVEEEEAGDVNN